MKRRDERRDHAGPTRREPRPIARTSSAVATATAICASADDEPGPLERPVERGQEPGVQRLRVGRRDVGQEPERPARDEGLRERVALLDVLLEDLVPLDREGDEPRQRGGRGDEEGRARRGMRCAMPPTTPERYAVVSCHVERPLDDRSGAFSRTRQRGPGGLAVAALMRPPDPEAGENDEELWLARAREAADRGPLGHHTHFTSPTTHARPAGPTGEHGCARGGLAPEHAAGRRSSAAAGGTPIATSPRACAELGYVDCTPRATRPGYLLGDAAWAELAAPAVVDLDGVALAVVPTTHGAGDLARGVARPGSPRVHAYFHDTDSRRQRPAHADRVGARPARPPPARDRPRRRSGPSSARDGAVRRLDGRRAGGGGRRAGVESTRAERGTNEPQAATKPRRRRTTPATSAARASTSSRAGPFSGLVRGD